MLKLNMQYNTQPKGIDDDLPIILNIHEVGEDSNWSHPMHAHDNIADIVLVTGGSGTLYYNNRKYATQKGDLLVFNMDTLHGEVSDAEDPRRSISISFTNIKINGLPYNHILPESVFPVLKTGDMFEVIYELILLMKKEFEKKAPGFAVAGQQFAVCLLSLMQQLLWNPVEIEPMQEEDDSLGLRIKEYIDEHYRENIRLEDIATAFHFSPYYLSHVFKEYSGFTINQYVIQRRIGEAQRLLSDTDMSIGDIARRVGYDNLNHFYVMFKKNKKYSPGYLREKLRRDMFHEKEK
ncbi:MAG: AraC family transcriptional regulator [Christensenellales bacterium]|jgi:YesN/AraC family two-component response regulator